MSTTEWETVEFIIDLPAKYNKIASHRWKVTYLPNKEAFLTFLWANNSYAHYSVQSKTWVSTHNFPQEVIAVAERIVTGKSNKLPKAEA